MRLDFWGELTPDVLLFQYQNNDSERNQNKNLGRKPKIVERKQIKKCRNKTKNLKETKKHLGMKSIYENQRIKIF